MFKQATSVSVLRVQFLQFPQFAAFPLKTVSLVSAVKVNDDLVNCAICVAAELSRSRAKGCDPATVSTMNSFVETHSYVGEVKRLLANNTIW